MTEEERKLVFEMKLDEWNEEGSDVHLFYKDFEEFFLECEKMMMMGEENGEAWKKEEVDGKDQAQAERTCFELFFQFNFLFSQSVVLC